MNTSNSGPDGDQTPSSQSAQKPNGTTSEGKPVPSGSVSSESVAYLIARSAGRWSDVYRMNAHATPAGQVDSATLGRSSKNQIVIRSEKASRQHARVFWDSDRGWLIEDLGSRNGTEVNRKKVSASDPQGGVRSLDHGDVIEIANHAIVFSKSMEMSWKDQSQGEGESRATRDAGLAEMDLLPAAPDGGDAQVTEEQITMGGSDAWSDHEIVQRRRQSRALHHQDHPSDVDGDGTLLQLAFELGSRQSSADRVEAAIETLSQRLKKGSLGVYLSIQGPITADTQENANKKIPLVATRQFNAKSYRRPPDELIAQVARVDAEALLARNVFGDSSLATENSQGEIDVESLIITPIRDASDRVWGVLHVTTSAGEAPLDDDQLEYVVTTAEILGESLSTFAVTQQLGRKLSRTRKQLAALQKQIGGDVEIVGASDAMVGVGEKIALASPTNATVLVCGESGVGKELVAAAIHHASPRKDGPLVCMNCAALSPSLLESELFGHEKGAFTGATERKQGKFESAHSGTLMMDEIGEMELDLQAKFLRVLEGHPFERVGGHRPIKADVRVVAATNRDLPTMVAEGKFRQDLYYRLHVIEIVVPPLRDRGEDVLLLADHFLKRFNGEMGRRIEGFTDKANAKLLAYDWPGNVRELKNVIERSVVLSNQTVLDDTDLAIDTRSVQTQPVIGNTAGNRDEMACPVETSLADLEKSHIERVLQHTSNNKSQAAKILGIERSTLDRKLKKWNQDE